MRSRQTSAASTASPASTPPAIPLAGGPVGRGLRRVRYGGKAVLLLVALLAPLVVSLGTHVVSWREERDQLRDERAGVAYLRQLVPMAHLIQRGYEEVLDEGGRMSGAEAALRAVDEVDQRYGAQLGVSGQWHQTRRAVQRATAGDLSYSWVGQKLQLERTKDAAASVRGMIDAVVDASDLVLDADLQSSYLRESLAYALPRNVEAVTSARGIVARSYLTATPYEAAVLANAATEVAASAGELRLTLDKAHHALPPATRAAMERTIRESEDLYSAVHRLLRTPGARADIVEAVVYTDVREYHAAAAQLTGTGMAALDALLAQRSAALDRETTLLLGLAVTAFALATYLLVLVFRTTDADLGTVLGGLESLAAGATEPRAPLPNRDELGTMSRAVERARERLGALLDEMSLQGRRFQSLVQGSSDVTLICDAAGRLSYVSPAVQGVLGVTPGEWLGRCLEDLVVVEDRTSVHASLEAMRRSPRGQSLLELRVTRADGSLRVLESTCRNLVEDPAVGGIVLNSRDVTERRALEERLAHQAFHDPLTRLPNRTLFRDRLEQALRRHAGRPAVVLLDLDGFKDVNDGLGHHAGDQVLTEVARRLLTCVRDGDTVARLGGDEFAFVLEHVLHEEAALEVADRVQRALLTPCVVGGLELSMRASLGVAVADHGAESADQLVRNADVAMYVGKRSGKGRAVVFTPSMHDEATERLDLSATLDGVVERGELELHYQPIADPALGRWHGVEALARWNRPGRGMVPPMSFVPLAEETGAILEIGRWVLRTACHDLVSLRASSPELARLRMAVNLSVRQLHDPRIVADVAAALQESGLPACALTLELTESCLVEEAGIVLERLAALRGLGAQVAVDDFGSGYSSLGYLRRLPVDVLKLDRSFVTPLGDDSVGGGPRGGVAHALAQGVLALGSALRLRCVAEGVETLEQAELLVGMGSPLLQGYLLGRPAPYDACREHLLAGMPLGREYAAPPAA